MELDYLADYVEIDYSFFLLVKLKIVLLQHDAS